MNDLPFIRGWPLLSLRCLPRVRHCLRLLVGDVGLVCKSVRKVDLLSNHFDSKHSRESVDLLLTCHPSLSLTTFSFTSSEVRRLLLDLDPYGAWHWPIGYVSTFSYEIWGCYGPRLSVVFRRLVRLFPGLLETIQSHSNSERSTVLLCYQLPTDFHNISIV